MSQQTWVDQQDLQQLPKIRRHQEWLQRLHKVKIELAEIVSEGRREGFC